MAKETGNPKETKRCFVVMGFGIKTDYATGRKLDLNKSYRLLIKPVVEEKGLICIRADEIRHSGSIDLPMYRELLQADVVIADLSTANVNAFYELGIRHALRPHTTIVISEDKLVYPFDLNHIKITSYTHLGEGIEYEEVERFRKVLGETLQAVLDKTEADSPVYTFLDNLRPPSLEEQIKQAVDQSKAITAELTAGDSESKSVKAENETLSLLIEQGEDAIRRQDFATAKALFESATLIGKAKGQTAGANNDAYLVHRLALATYKARKPDPVTSLKNALELLGQLDLNHTNDPETVALAGAIEKHLYELGQPEDHLSNAILYFQRGYYLLNNRYNGINLAYMLNCRANSSLCLNKQEQVADLVYAGHTRRRVLLICDNDAKQLADRESRALNSAADNIETVRQQAFNNEQKFWIEVNRAEAYFGLGMFEEYKSSVDKASSIEHDQWMMDAFQKQIDKIRLLLKNTGNLLTPKWKEPR
ncbi:DUF4071 domain-containing protein [Segetibacter sp. 3557_3]|uniref:tetratricopeptide repeat-containing protein n=1 Tax=Segetibacter sp. 3557_3 TaxID=2547429 RepID=UPI001058F7B2|nr:tetratricopeptide repeat-containing protein [Segetibacter sp. 3557_3]TDH21457.1 DUF4071 domain-containing protein [Segetibacter sp. 3557_3]